MSSEEGTLSITAPPRALPRRRPAQAASLTAALALALTACGGGDPAPTETTTTAPASSTQAADTPTATATATAGASPSTPDGGTAQSSGSGRGSGSGPASATASGPYVPASAEGPAQNVPKPVMPEVMKEETQEGAEAAVKYFWETVYYMQQTGDAGPTRTASWEACAFCSHIISSMEAIYSNEGWFTGTQSNVSSARLRPSSSGYNATLIMNFSSGTGYMRDGSTPEGGNVPESKGAPWVADLIYDDDLKSWFVESMTFQGRGDR
ncbi:DUF6318 family protein [Micrococcaceae bacterium Sec6.3]